MQLDPNDPTRARQSSGKEQLWARFLQPASLDDFYFSWLALQCGHLSHPIQAVLLRGNPTDIDYQPVAKWPATTSPVERLVELCEQVIETRVGTVVELAPQSGQDTNGGPTFGLGYPLLIDGALHGVIAVEVNTSTTQILADNMAQLQWGSGWLELTLKRRKSRKDDRALNRLDTAVALLAEVLAAASYREAAIVLVTELAARMNCDRAGYGRYRRGRISVQAVSHAAQIAPKMKQMRALAAAMEEAVSQRQALIFPPDPDKPLVITQNQKRLAQLNTTGAVMTFPLYHQGRYTGAVTLERPEEKTFGEDDLLFCQSMASLAAAALEEKRLNERPLVLKIGAALKQQVARLLGRQYWGRKAATLLAAGLLVFFYFARDDYRLAADTVLEAKTKRVIAAPFGGYIQDAFVRAGDLVQKDDLLCRLDDRELRLERLNWLSQRTRFQRQAQDALAKHNRAEVRIIEAKKAQADAQLKLVESRLKRTQIPAPFDGYVLNGDLSQALGKRVEQGEVLFEIAPIKTYRVILRVDERRIGDLRPGQTGRLVLAALPREGFKLRVVHLTPIAVAREGRNYFRVEAELLAPSPRMRPGMEGVSRIMIDRRNLFGIWTRDLSEWATLQLWRWGL